MPKRRKSNAPSPAPIAEQPAASQLPAPVPEVVALAEQFLADAKSGLVRAAGIAIVLADARTDARTGIAPGDIVMTHVLNSAVTSLRHLFAKAMHPELPVAAPQGAPQ